MTHDPVTSPDHYMVYPVQPIAITRHLGFCLGNAVKYVLRAPYKGDAQGDLRKALQYIVYEVQTPAPPLSHDAFVAMETALDHLVNYLAHGGPGSGGSLAEEVILEAQADFLTALFEYLDSHSGTDLANVCRRVNDLAQKLEQRAS